MSIFNEFLKEKPVFTGLRFGFGSGGGGGAAAVASVSVSGGTKVEMYLILLVSSGIILHFQTLQT